MGFRSFAFFFFLITFKTFCNFILHSRYLNCQLPLKVDFWFGFFLLSYAKKDSAKLLDHVTCGKDNKYYFKKNFFHGES